MHLWKVELLMSCGEYLTGYLECNHSDSASVARELMKGAPNTFNSIMNKEKTKQLLFKTGDVSVIMLSAA